MKHEYYEGIDLIQTTLLEIDQVNKDANLKVLNQMKDRLITKLKEIREKMNKGISDVVIKFDEPLYTWVLKTIKINE